MGRRRQAPRSAHRQAIAAAAQELFQQRGIPAVTMDDIARAAGYSKATLYVYFKNKEELVSVLVLESMQKLDAYLDSALRAGNDTRDRYDRICRGLLCYREEYPFYFQMALEEIKVDSGQDAMLPEAYETYQVGEEINKKMTQFLRSGVEAGALRADLELLVTMFSFWGMLSGLIQTAANKETYLEQDLGITRRAFLEYGFDLLFRSVAAGEGAR